MSIALATEMRPTLRLVTGDESPEMVLTEVGNGFCEYLRVERNAPNNTLTAYKRDLQDLIDFLGDLDISQVSMSDLRAFLKSLYQKGHCAATIGRKLSTLRSFFVYAQREGLVEKNHARALRAPKVESKLPHLLDSGAIGRLLEAPGRDYLGLRDRAILETFYSAGVRISELAGLEMADLDLKAGTIKVMGKGSRERLAPLGQPATTALREWLSTRGEGGGALFLNYQDNRLSVRGIQKMLVKHLKAAGLDPTTTPHSLRHSYATHMLDNGADIRMVQELLGHKSITSTQRYTQVSVARQRVAHRQYHPRG